LDAIPWYKSPVYIGAVVTILSTITSLSPKLAALLGSPDAISQNVTAFFSLVALGSGIFTAVKRQNSAVQPLTMTQAAADVHPATVANAAAKTASPTPPKGTP
jgi:hypothetical protein